MVVLVRCPFHDDSTPSLALYHDHAYCFGGCGRIPFEWLPEGLRKLVVSQEPVRGREAREKFSRRQLEVLTDVWNWQLLDGPRRHRVAWLKERGIDEAAIRRFRLGHSGAWFTIPVLVGSEVTGVRFRRDPYYLDDDEEPKYRNPKGQPTLLYRPNPRGWPTVVAEGELDALLLCLVGCDAVTSTAGAQSLAALLEREGLLRKYRRSGVLHVATDQDVAGENAARQLSARGVRVCRWRWEEGKDVSEALAVIPRNQWSRWVRQRIQTGEVLVQGRNASVAGVA